MNDAGHAQPAPPGVLWFTGVRRSVPFVVRPYRPGDRAAIRRLCCDTGFLGQPIERVFADRELYADLYVEPYLRYEEDLAFVAEAEGRVVGYLLGAARADFARLRVFAASRVALKMLARYVEGAYRHSPDGGRFVRWLLTRSFREQPPRPDCAAHLHFNLSAEVRGRGVAIALWRRFEMALRERAVSEYYAQFLSYPGRQPERVYLRYGLRECARRRCRVFDGALSVPVWLVCMHKPLAAAPAAASAMLSSAETQA